MGGKVKTAKRPFYTRKWFIALAVIIVLMAVAGGSDKTSDVKAVATSAISASADSTTEAPMLDDVVLKPSTEFLEYSSKITDPLKLVACNKEDVEVSTKDSIDLNKVGNQTITYQVSNQNQSISKTVSFVVRDTKAPIILLGSTSVEINQGDEIDISSNIKSVADDVDGAISRTDTSPTTKGMKAGYEEFYPAGWYTTEGAVDSSTPGSYQIKVTASDKHGNTASKEFTVVVKETRTATPAAPVVRSYVLNTNPNSHKFHIPSCSSVKQMSDSNRWDVEMTREEVINMGYEPCKRCNP